MVQKLTRIVVLSVFALLSTGVMATIHLCQNQNNGLDWFSSDEKKCSCPESSEDMPGCCDTLVVQFDHDEIAPTAPLAVPSDLIVGDIEPIVATESDTNQPMRSSLMEQARDPVPILPRWLLFNELRILDAC